jgi:hypothetical protein
MCKYCEDKKEVIKTSKFNECDLEIFIDVDNSLCINAYNHSSSLTEDICENFEINNCPMCGRELKS